MQAGALRLTQAVDDSYFQVDALQMRTLVSFMNAVLNSIPTEAQSEAIHGNPDLQLHPLLRQITQECNCSSAADHEALELKAMRTLLLHFDSRDDNFAAHRQIGSQMIASSYLEIAH